MKLKRSEFVFFYHKNGPIFDILSIMKGEINMPESEQLLAFPILHGQEVILSNDDFEKLKEISTSNWVEVNYKDISENEFYKKFAENGIVLIDGLSDRLQFYVQKEANLNEQKWNIYAAFFHFLTKWKNVDVQLNPEDYAGNENIDLYHKSMDAVIENYGIPPSHFNTIETTTEKVNLPLVDKSGDAYFDIVLKRKTGRVYDKEKAMDLEILSTLLYYTWGCHGIYEMHPKLKMLHKTAPSGGSLHPTECYVLALNISNLLPGIYHYNVEEHSLHLLTKVSRVQAEDLANNFIAGQNYVRNANALFIMTTRYFRNFWKYRQHTLAYKVTQLDAAHLSQMFYLNCAKLNLRCFVTGALNTQQIETELGIDGFQEGATLIVGCGYEDDNSEANLLEPEFKPYKIVR